MVTTRTATVDDLAAITRLMNEFHSTPAQAERLKAQVEQIVVSSRSAIMIIEQADEPIGMAIIDLLYKLPKIEARVNEVVLSEHVRGHGYGATLMEACADWAWQHQADLIELSSRPSRVAANKLYQSLGYQLRDTNVYTLERPA